MRLVVFAVCAFTLLQLYFCQDIVFPNNDDFYTHVSGAGPVTERKPIKVGDNCGPNMLLYPGDGSKSVWTCDCRPGFVYFPKNNSCHEAFMQGPCPENYYVFLPLNDTLPICMKNTCKENGVVPYKGICHPLRAKGGPCGPDSVLSVNETNFQLECLEINLVPFVIIDAPNKDCPEGFSKNTLGICKKII